MRETCHGDWRFGPAGVAATLVCVSLMGLASHADADWPSDPSVNLPVCTAVNNQSSCDIAAGTAGSAIIVWQDRQAGTDYDIYAQRVLADGTLDPAWPVGGLAVCTATGNQFAPRIIADGSGGAIIAWTDFRNGPDMDVYAQHVLSTGALDPAWPKSDLPVCTEAGNQTVPQKCMVPDGAGGALVAFMDTRADTSVYVQHVLLSGEVDPLWPVGGRSSGAVVDFYKSATMVVDGSGGAIVAWPDHRAGSTFDIYAQHVVAGGSLDPTWPAGALAVCTAANDQLSVDAVEDKAGGAIVAWQDQRNVGNADIYAHHVLADGALDSAWPVNGLGVCTVLGNQQYPRLISDGSGGAIAVWTDLRIGTNQDLYAHHILSSGTLDPGWAPTGQVICAATGAQQNQSLVPDGAGGAVVAWDDFRAGTGNLDVYAQHILSVGSVDFDWPVNGRCVSSAPLYQNAPRAIPDGAGGAIIAWNDQRSGGNTPYDIYAQRVQANGQLGGTVVGVPESGAVTFGLEPVRPNPSGASFLSLGLSLPAELHVSVELLDVSGRMIARRDLGTLPAGHQSIEFETPAGLGAGLYFVRVEAGRVARAARVAIIH